MGPVRQPILAGTWYPGSPGALADQVDDFLANAPADARPAGRPLVAVVPHAGYTYSGATAGKLYGLLAGPAPRRVVILAPNHRTAIAGIALPVATAYATPLGQVAVDTAAVDRLAADPVYELNDTAHAAEHAIEIQLPFLQRLWPDQPPPIVPLLVPPLDTDRRRRAAAALGEVIDDHTLLLVSTDFTHYGAAYGYVPFTDDLPAALERLDTGAILKILSADPDGLVTYGEQTGITMCGLQATALALACGLPAGYEAALIDYARSGDRDSDYSLSVSYAAILMCRGDTTRSGPEPGGHAT